MHTGGLSQWTDIISTEKLSKQNTQYPGRLAMDQQDKEEVAPRFEDNIIATSDKVVLPPTRARDPRSKAKYNLISRLLFWYVQHGIFFL